MLRRNALTAPIFRQPQITGHLAPYETSRSAYNRPVLHVVGPADHTAADRRRGDRRRVLKSAMIVFNGGHCTLGCQILDVSDSGALVMPADAFLCPAEFVLKPRVGSPRDCEVVWRRGDKVGVRYT
jgi:hypothetical protein